MGAYQTIPDRTAVASYSYKIVQLNVIMDVLGGWFKELDVEMNKILDARSCDVLKRMQKAVLSSSLNIARTFKVITK